MGHTKSRKKLSLSRETIKRLDAGRLAKVAGGAELEAFNTRICNTRNCTGSNWTCLRGTCTSCDGPASCEERCF